MAIVCCGRHRLSSVGFADDTVPIYMSTDYRRFTLVGRGPTSASTGGRVSRIYKSCCKLLLLNEDRIVDLSEQLITLVNISFQPLAFQ